MNFRLQELRHKTKEVQQSVVSQLMSHVDILIKAKEHTANSLKGVRNFAETQ
jgi:kinetochore protein NDC80